MASKSKLFQMSRDNYYNIKDYINRKIRHLSSPPEPPCTAPPAPRAGIPKHAEEEEKVSQVHENVVISAVVKPVVRAPIGIIMVKLPVVGFPSLSITEATKKEYL